jgi:hypothetical protein
MEDPSSWRSLAWWKENIDTLAVIAVVALMSMLGTVNIISPAAIVQTLPAVLGIFAIATLRDRSRSRSEIRQITELVGVVERTDQKIDDLAALRVLHGDEVGAMLAKARASAATWIFRGGTGTHTRAVTLPDCVARARRERRVLQVRLEVLDPTAATACEEYAQLYRRLATGPEDDASTWTGDGTRRESYATILAACWYKQHYAPLQIDVALTEAISTFRYDMSSQYLIITQRGPRFQAMLLPQGHPHYDYWRFELDMSFGRSKQLAIASALARCPLAEQPDVEQARSLFLQLGIELPVEYSDEDVRQIITKATVPERNPVVRGAGELVSTRTRW